MSMAAGVKVREGVVRRLRKRLEEEVKDSFVKLVDEPSVGGELGLEVTTALSDDTVERLVKLVLREARGPLSWRELKAVFQGIVGEDRLRKILSHLKAEGEIAELTRTRYSMPEYVPEEERGKVKNYEAVRKRMGNRWEAPGYPMF